ncbi:uncharacterized protein LOC125551676 isoform X2 [Triticum urartu]|uniref:uncharacterized protein LOC125529307 isoform X2 n=1 Tax=Triticum urartu TaxID=4572 RepID=UPI002043655B|nr:uncharacterized protein LOC125529307 isoform X2 [Triticum urartu]XP_048570913.1 uncharacterized protein LOC125551676 isoform X2 [Triticum urartu]
MHLSENEGIEGVRFAVTVGQGFVGAALCLELIRRGALEVCSLDSSTCAIPPLGPSSSSTPASASYKEDQQLMANAPASPECAGPCNMKKTIWTKGRYTNSQEHKDTCGSAFLRIY